MSGTANRVLKNTCYLYARMGITMFISLYTTRIILNSLGASDFGIFNIVGGAIGMLGFLNAAMADATQRFMSYSEGEGNKEKQKKIFNVSFILHLILAIIVGFALIVAGHFFFNGIFNIPTEKEFAAKVIYGSLIISTIFTVMTVPYNAVMNAHENMKYYAVMGFIEAPLKLLVAIVCMYTSSDKLIIYGVLMACIPLIMLTIMRIYCHKHYEECIIAPYTHWNKKLMKEMVSFAGWNLASSIASILTMQGVSIVLNSFWGVLANAAQGIANQLSGQIMVFSRTMLTALNPIIVKNEGANNREKMLEATLAGNKFSYLIMIFFSIPFCIEMPFILKIWLKEPPEYAVLFCRLILLRLSITQLTITFNTAIGATGKNKNSNLMTSIIMIFMLPLTSLLYYWGAPIYTIYVVLIIMVILLFISSIFFMKRLCNLKISQFIEDVIKPCLIVSSITLFIGLLPLWEFEESFLRFIIVSSVCCISFGISFYTIGLNQKEKQLMLSLLNNIIKRNDYIFKK